MSAEPRWILAFDAGCGSCARLSHRIERAGAGRLETLPLRHRDVTAWRDATLGPDAPWAPTLLRVEGDDVRAWPGRSMVLPLVRQLGLRSSLAVTHALGSLRDEIAADAEEPAGLVSRKRFLQFGAGAVIAGALVVRGAMPAYASTSVERWVEAHADRLPTTYAGITRLPVDYRRAIFARLTPAQRSALWTEHVQAFRAARADLTAAQRRVLDDALATARRRATFAKPGRAGDGGPALRTRAEDAFGPAGAAALLATLGPADEATAKDTRALAAAACSCSYNSDFCFGSCVYRAQGCGYRDTGCGEFYVYPCNGCCDGSC